MRERRWVRSARNKKVNVLSGFYDIVFNLDLAEEPGLQLYLDGRLEVRRSQKIRTLF